MIGHALGACGGSEANATIKAINTGWLHPTINQYDLELEVTIDTVPNVKKQHQVNVAISNSFGFGGHNSVAVFAPFSPRNEIRLMAASSGGRQISLFMSSISINLFSNT